MLFKKLEHIVPWVDCVIFMSKKGLTTTTEQKILKKTIEFSEKYKFPVIFLFNKIDELINYEDDEGCSYEEYGDDPDADDDMETFCGGVRTIEKILKKEIQICCSEKYIRKRSNLRERFKNEISRFTNYTVPFSQYIAIPFSSHALILKQQLRNNFANIDIQEIIDFGKKYLRRSEVKGKKPEQIKKKLCEEIKEKDVEHYGVEVFSKVINTIVGNHVHLLNLQISKIINTIESEKKFNLNSHHIHVLQMIVTYYKIPIDIGNIDRIVTLTINFIKELDNSISSFIKFQKEMKPYLSFIFGDNMEEARIVFMDIMNERLESIYEELGICKTLEQIILPIKRDLERNKIQKVINLITKKREDNNKFENGVSKYEKEYEQILSLVVKYAIKKDVKIVFYRLCMLKIRCFEDFKKIIEQSEDHKYGFIDDLKTKRSIINIIITRLFKDGQALPRNSEEMDAFAGICIDNGLCMNFIDIFNKLVVAVLKGNKPQNIQMWIKIKEIFSKMNIKNQKLKVFWECFQVIRWDFLVQDNFEPIYNGILEYNTFKLIQVELFYQRVNNFVAI